MPGAPYIRLQGVGKRYDTKDGPVDACADIDLDIRQSEFIAIVGPSGCGKTTILKMVAGLVPHSAGSITVGAKPVERPLTDVGIVFQEAILLDWRDVLSNVMLQVDIRGSDAAAGEREARHLLEITGLSGFEHKKPYELSGGMRQRVSLIRTLVHDPSLLLMDEPFGALDALTRLQVRMDLEALWLRRRPTVLFITHSVEEAVGLSDRIFVMSPSPGEVIEEIHVELPRPRPIVLGDAPEFAAYVDRIHRQFEKMGVLHGAEATP